MDIIQFIILHIIVIQHAFLKIKCEESTLIQSINYFNKTDYEVTSSNRTIFTRSISNQDAPRATDLATQFTVDETFATGKNEANNKMLIDKEENNSSILPMSTTNLQAQIACDNDSCQTESIELLSTSLNSAKQFQFPDTTNVAVINATLVSEKTSTQYQNEKDTTYTNADATFELSSLSTIRTLQDTSKVETNKIVFTTINTISEIHIEPDSATAPLNSRDEPFTVVGMHLSDEIQTSSLMDNSKPKVSDFEPDSPTTMASDFNLTSTVIDERANNAFNNQKSIINTTYNYNVANVTSGNQFKISSQPIDFKTTNISFEEYSSSSFISYAETSGENLNVSTITSTPFTSQFIERNVNTNETKFITTKTATEASYMEQTELNVASNRDNVLEDDNNSFTTENGNKITYNFYTGVSGSSKFENINDTINEVENKVSRSFENLPKTLDTSDFILGGMSHYLTNANTRSSTNVDNQFDIEQFQNISAVQNEINSNQDLKTIDNSFNIVTTSKYVFSEKDFSDNFTTNLRSSISQSVVNRTENIVINEIPSFSEISKSSETFDRSSSTTEIFSIIASATEPSNIFTSKPNEDFRLATSVTTNELVTPIMVEKGKIPDDHEAAFSTRFSTISNAETSTSSINYASSEISTISKKVVSTTPEILYISLGNLSEKERKNIITCKFTISIKKLSKEELLFYTKQFHKWSIQTIKSDQTNFMNKPRNSSESFDISDVRFIRPTPFMNESTSVFSFVVRDYIKNRTADHLLSLLLLNLIDVSRTLNSIQGCCFLGLYSELSNQHCANSPKNYSSIQENSTIIYICAGSAIFVATLLLLLVIIFLMKIKRKGSASFLEREKFNHGLDDSLDVGNTNSNFHDENDKKNIILSNVQTFSVDDNEGWLVPMGQKPIVDLNPPAWQDTPM